MGFPGTDKKFSAFAAAGEKDKGLYQNKLLQTLRDFKTLRVSGRKNCTGYFFTNPK